MCGCLQVTSRKDQQAAQLIEPLKHCCQQWSPPTLLCCVAVRAKSHPASAVLLALLCSRQGSKHSLSNDVQAMLCSLVTALSPSIPVQQYWFNTKISYKFVPVMIFADAFKQCKTGLAALKLCQCHTLPLLHTSRRWSTTSMPFLVSAGSGWL